MDTAPSLAPAITPLYHRHYWRPYAVTDGEGDDVIAICDDCPETMDKAAIEAALNGLRFLTDESEG